MFGDIVDTFDSESKEAVGCRFARFPEWTSDWSL